MSVITSACSKTFLATVSALVMVAVMLFGANIATADSVWVQSYERSSQTEACVAQPGETQWQASWGANSSWSPSWEQWANNGNGGWVCTRSITWARTPAAASSGGGSVTYALGDTGPGGGLVFLISGGLTYEMAPNTWDAYETKGRAWITNATKCFAAGSSTANETCEYRNLYPETTIGAQSASTAAASAIGMGSANTDAIIARMNAGSVTSSDYAAGVASAYTGGTYSDWFLPSEDELNATCNYSRNPDSPPTGTCTGLQDVTFTSSTYGFNNSVSVYYWSSSQNESYNTLAQSFGGGFQGGAARASAHSVRPIRAF